MAKKYRVSITESHTYGMEVEADSPEEAEERALQLAVEEGQILGGLYDSEAHATLIAEAPCPTPQ